MVCVQRNGTLPRQCGRRSIRVWQSLTEEGGAQAGPRVRLGRNVHDSRTARCEAACIYRIGETQRSRTGSSLGDARGDREGWHAGVRDEHPTEQDIRCGQQDCEQGSAGGSQVTAEVKGAPLIGRMLISNNRKSTRLNSSHQIISYAVFCLKKKKKKT